MLGKFGKNFMRVKDYASRWWYGGASLGIVGLAMYWGRPYLAFAAIVPFLLSKYDHPWASSGSPWKKACPNWIKDNCPGASPGQHPYPNGDGPCTPWPRSHGASHGGGYRGYGYS